MAEINLAKIISPVFIPVLNAVLANKYTHYWLKGGRMSTKSSFVALLLVVLMVLDKNANFVCLRKVERTLRESVYNQILWAIDKLGLNDYFTCTLSPLSIRYYTGQKFYFRGCDDPRKIKSIKCEKGYLKGAWFEELAEFSGMKEIRTVNQSIIRGGEDFVMFYSFNPPEDGMSWVNQETLVENPERLIHSSTYLDVPPDWLGQQAIQEANLLKQIKPEDYEHEYLGLTSRFTPNVVKYFTDDNIQPVYYQPDLPIHITTDFNCDPMAWHLAHIDWDKEKVYFFDELVIENTTTVKTIDEFHGKMVDCGNGKANYNQKIIINGDASGSNRSTQSEFANYALMQNRLSALGYRNVQIKLRPSNGLIRNRVAAWNEKIVNLKGERCIIIDPKCKWLIYNCKNLKYKEGTRDIDIPTASAIKRDRELKFLSHPFDSASYLINTYFPIKLEH